MAEKEQSKDKAAKNPELREKGTTLLYAATCPFFISDSNKGTGNICCEGIYGSHNKIIFKRHRDKVKHANEFCTGKYQACKVYKAIMTKYEE